MISDEGDFGLGDLHQTLQDGERVVIHRARPEDRALYLDFLHDVSAEDLRLRFFGRIAELSAAEIDKGHGLGWLLMQRIIDYAKEKGLRRVYGDVLAENRTMLQMCAELGFRARDIGSDIRRVVLELGNSGKQ